MFSKRPFFTAVVILVCLLGAMNYAQNPPQSPLTADDFNQFTWRWIGPMTFSGRITGFAVPRGQSRVLRADRRERRLEDRGRRHLVRADLREGRHAQHGLDGHRAVRIRTSSISAPASRCTRGRARTATASGNRRTRARRGRRSASRRATSSTRSRSTRRTPTSSTWRPKGSSTTTRWTPSGASSRARTAARRGRTLGPMKDRGVADFVIDPRNSDVIIAASYKTRPPGLDLHRPSAGQRALQEHRRRQDVEEADERPAAGRRRSAGRASRSSRRTRTSSTRGSTRR